MSDTKPLTKEGVESITGVENEGGNMSDKEKFEKRLGEAMSLLGKYRELTEAMRTIIVRVIEDAETVLDHHTDFEDQFDYLTTSWDDEDDDEAEQQKV